MKTKLKKGLVVLMMFTLIFGVKIDASARQVTSDLNEMFNLVNNFRTSSDAWCYAPDGTKMNCTGLTKLTYDSSLQAVAQERAQELVTKYSHERPDGTHAVGSVPGVYAENIAYGDSYLGSASSIFEAWKETNEPYSGQGHRRNMLGIMYTNNGLENWTNTSIGIGHVEENGRHYWVQLFGSQVQWDASAHVKPATNTPAEPEQPGTEEPGTTEPEQPGTQEPEQPGATEPEQPGTQEPQQPGTQQPGLPNIIPGAQYTITSGTNTTWTKGSGKPLVMISDGDFSKFTGIEIDGVAVDKSNYEAVAGSTVVTLKPEYVESLAAGDHTYRVNYTDGAVETTFKIAAPTTVRVQDTTTRARAPKTADSTSMMMILLAMSAAAGGIYVSMKARKNA